MLRDVVEYHFLGYRREAEQAGIAPQPFEVVFLGVAHAAQRLHRAVGRLRAGVSGEPLRRIGLAAIRLARIVEGSDGRVLSVYSHTLPGTTRIEVTLKINREDISDMLQTFERYDIFVKTTYQGSRFHDDLRNRYDELMRFINL